MKVAGLDIGSTGCKVSLYGLDGGLIREAYREYGSDASDELDTDTLWAHVRDMLREIAVDCGDLAAIGLTSLGEAAVLLDEADRPLMPALLYTDPRGAEQAETLIERFGTPYIAQRTGLKAHGMFTLPKMMWIRAEHPALFERARCLLLMQDFVAYRLSGARAIDAATASRSMAFDVGKRDWDDSLLDFAGIPRALWSAPVPFGTAVGTIRTELAKALGLPQGVWVVIAAHDQVAAAIGSGVLTAGQAVDGAGTVQCVTPVLQTRPPWKEMMESGYAVVPFPGNQYATYAFSFTGGALLKWYRQQIAKPGMGYDALNALVSETPSGLLALPHFAGAATPYMNPKARGAIVGLTTATTAAEIYRALMEGVAYEMRLNLECLAQCGIRVDQLYATGGGALSQPWLQIKADILKVPITTLGAANAGNRGCAMLAAVACGLLPSLEAAAARFVPQGRTVSPQSRHRAEYDGLYEQYKRLYGAVGSVLSYA